MRIGIDATLVRGDRISGIERYIIELIMGLSKIADKEVKFEIYIHPLGEVYFKNLPTNFKIKKSPYKNRIMTEQVWLPFIINKSTVDIIHLTTLGPSPLIKKRSLVTVHDAIPWKFPETLSKGMRFYYKPLLTHFIKRKYSKIITVSDSAKYDLSAIFKLNGEKIVKIYNGKSEHFKKSPLENIIKTKVKYNLPDNYILTYGTLEPRKNIKTLLEAFCSISDKINEKLVIVGRRGWVKKYNIPNDVKENIIFTGFVDDSDLVDIISGAKLFIFPSLYEGFGLPLVEAQSCGVPTIVSKTPSLLEISNNTSEFFDPKDKEEIGKKIINLLSNRTRLEELKLLGLKNSTRFTWENTCIQVLELYKRLFFY